MNIKIGITNGFIDPESLKQHAEKSNDLALRDLYEVACHDAIVEMSVSSSYNFKNNKGQIQNSEDIMEMRFNIPSDYDTNSNLEEHRALERDGYPIGKSFSGNAGRSLFPGSNSITGANSTNNNIQVIINANGNLNHRAIGSAHELVHVLLYLRGLPHQHGKPGVDDFILSRTNPIIKRLGYDF